MDTVRKSKHNLNRRQTVAWGFLILCLSFATFARSNGAPQEPSAQQSFTLKEAVLFAIAHSPRLTAARSRIEARRGALLSARSMEPPIVNPGVTISGEAGTPILTQKVEISGRLKARTAVAQHELVSAERAYDSVELDVVRDIESAYADLVGAQSALTVASDVADVIRRVRDSIKKQVDVGQLAAQELTKAQVELARADLETVRSQSAFDRSRQAFNVVLGRTAELPANATEPISFSTISSELPDLLRSADANRPEILGAEADIRAAKASVGLQRSDLRPDLDVNLLQNTNIRSSGFMRPESTGVGLSLAFPLFDTGRIRGRIRQAGAEVRVFESLLTDVKLQVSQDVTDALTRVRATEALVTRYQQEIIPASKDLLAKAEFGYARGALTLLDFLEAQRTYRATQLEFYAALTDNAKARADLDRAIGRKTTP